MLSLCRSFSLLLKQTIQLNTVREGCSSPVVISTHSQKKFVKSHEVPSRRAPEGKSEHRASQCEEAGTFSLGKLQRASVVHENKGMGVDAAGLAALIRQPLSFIRVLESRGN